MNSFFVFPGFDKNIFSFGNVNFFGNDIEISAKWYGLMYILGGLFSFLLLKKRAKRYGFSEKEIEDGVLYALIGAILGGRIGYMLFYQFSSVLENPLSILAIHKGGMSFHGGFLGVLLAMFILARANNKTFFQVADFAAPTVPIGLGLGRLGNFINGELWGRVTDVPWGFVFPHVDDYVRHPSQIYQLLLEGVAMFICLNLYQMKKRNSGEISGLFVLLYGSFRFIVEYFRQPDSHIGLHWNLFSHGQLLSMPLFLLGCYLLLRHKLVNKI